MYVDTHDYNTYVTPIAYSFVQSNFALCKYILSFQGHIFFYPKPCLFAKTTLILSITYYIHPIFILIIPPTDSNSIQIN